MKDRTIEANGLRFHIVEDGPADGALVLLLHGFPEHAHSWRHQLPALAAQGYHAVAPDLRGYNLSDKPLGVARYDLDVLADDVVGWMATLGYERAHLVGHDWGAAVVWHTAARHPQRCASMTALACPPPQELGRALATNFKQLLRSRYMLFFQLPWLPERLLRGARFRRWLTEWAGRDGVFAEEDIDRFAQATERPGGLGPALNYYRAAFRRVGDALRTPTKVTCPTMVIWGKDDPILGVELTNHLSRYVEGTVRLEVLPGVGHFVQQDAPAEVNRLLIAFLESISHAPKPGGSK